MVFGSVLTAAELEFSRTSSWSMINSLDSLDCFSFQFIKNGSQGSTTDVRRVRTYTYFYWRTQWFWTWVSWHVRSFFPMIFQSFQNFLVLIILCLKTYYYKFDLWFISLFLEETNSLLFKFILKKSCFSIFHTNCLIDISPYLKALTNLGFQ